MFDALDRIGSVVARGAVVTVAAVDTGESVDGDAVRVTPEEQPTGRATRPTTASTNRTT
jgi:hypothetical protein